MRPLVLALALLLPSLASAQTIMRGEGVINGEVHADVYNGAVLVIDPEDTTLNTLTTSVGDVTQLDDNVSGLSFTSLVGNDPAESSVTTGDGRTVAALLFDDANTEELSTASSVADAGGFAGVVVFAPDDVSINQAPLCIGDTGTSTDYSMIYVTSGAVYQAYTSDTGSGASAAVLQSVSAEPTTFRIRETFTGGRYGGSDGFDESGTAASRSPSSLDVTAIGKRIRNSSDFYISGKVLAVYLFSSDITDDHLRAVENYLHKAKIHDPGAGIPGPGLVLDLDATESSSITITSSPDVDAWANRAGKGTVTSVTQGTASQKPHDGGTINGLNAITFDDAASQYLSTSTAAVTAAPFSTFVVCATDANSAEYVALSLSDVSDSFDSFWNLTFQYPAGQARFKVRESSTVQAGFSISTARTFVAYVYEESASSRGLIIDGTEDTETTSLTPAGVDTTSVGSYVDSAPGEYFSGDIGRVLLWKRKLTDAEHASAAARLSADWE